jgi:Cu-processing system ATP-binding protein
MIEINGLKKSYGKFSVLKDLNLCFDKSSVTVLMGPNGSGKTTLLKCILGLVIPEKGVISVNGIDIRNNYLYREYIGYMPQTAFYPENLKVKEVISIIKNIRGNENAVDFELVEQFNIESYINKSISSLSQGMKQRLSASLAFMFDSPIIILDEPTAGLDPHSSDFLKEKIIKEKTKGKLIILTTHIKSDAEELADRFIFMLDGKISIDEANINNNHTTQNAYITELISGLFQEK